MLAVGVNRAEMTASCIEVRKRRRIVALPKNRSKSNRVLGRELGVSECTIRRDRKMLTHPELDRCSLKARPVEKILRPYDWQSPYYRKRMIKAAQRWVWDEDMRPGEWKKITPWIRNRLMNACSGEPPTVDPARALQNLRPKDLDPEDGRSYCVWLTNWLEYCLPGDRLGQLQILDKIGEHVESRRYPMKRSREAPIAQIRHLSFW